VFTVIKKLFPKDFIKHIPAIFGILSAIISLLAFPAESAEGVREGLSFLGSDILPALFPFMVISSYISENRVIHKLALISDKFTKKIFKANGYSIVCFLLSILGGYPVGAKAVRDYFVTGRLTQNEAERLLYWCINPSPAFTITAIGLIMTGNLKNGILIYSSCILASLTIGFFCRFINDNSASKTDFSIPERNEASLVKAVTSSTEAMLGICGWVLIFSSFSSIISALPLNESIKIFLKSICEVTTGCNTAISNGLPSSVITAITAFGGFAVICQISTLISVCNVKTSRLICSRVIASSVSVLYYSFITKLFPQYTQASVTISTESGNFILYKSIPATILLLTMCVLFILEVDNRKKVW
jgi:hypothetical protein